VNDFGTAKTKDGGFKTPDKSHSFMLLEESDRERYKWWPRVESNHRHTDSQSSAIQLKIIRLSSEPIPQLLKYDPSETLYPRGSKIYYGNVFIIFVASGK